MNKGDYVRTPNGVIARIIDIQDEEIRKLRLEVNRLKKQVIKANLEAQRYFDMLMEKID